MVYADNMENKDLKDNKIHINSKKIQANIKTCKNIKNKAIDIYNHLKETINLKRDRFKNVEDPDEWD